MLSRKKAGLFSYLISTVLLLVVSSPTYAEEGLKMPDALKDFRLERSEYTTGVNIVAGEDETQSANGRAKSFRLAGSYKKATVFFERESFTPNLSDTDIANGTTVTSYTDSVLGLSYKKYGFDFRLTQQKPTYMGNSENIFIGVGAGNTNKSDVGYGRISVDLNMDFDFNVHTTGGLKIPVDTIWLLYGQPFAEIRIDVKTAVEDQANLVVGGYAGMMWGL